MIVGGDSNQPEALVGTAIFARAPGYPFARRTIFPAGPTHGYRSSVAYDSTHGTWIAVGLAEPTPPPMTD